MAERKVINKYYPPDFDPSKVERLKKKERRGTASLPTVRLMSPFSMRCDTCGEYISKARKFNAKKENTGKTYLGLKIVRFYIKCTRCSSEIVYRTDPKSADYVIEHGAKRNYDSAKNAAQLKEESMEEILERLEREDQEEQQQELQREKKQTSLEDLETKLNDIRHQQQINEQLNNIIEKNLQTNQDVTRKQAQVKLFEAQAELHRKQEKLDDELANEAFAKFTAAENTHSTPNLPQRMLIKRKSNKLGVKRKK